MIRIPTHRSPTHPGEMLLKEFLEPMTISSKELADKIFLPHQQINDIIDGSREITPSIALRLAKFFGTSPDFWLNLQLRWDLYYALQKETHDLEKIEQYSFR
jgi:addiction module HigA family antidote